MNTKYIKRMNNILTNDFDWQLSDEKNTKKNEPLLLTWTIKIKTKTKQRNKIILFDFSGVFFLFV